MKNRQCRPDFKRIMNEEYQSPQIEPIASKSESKPSNKENYEQPKGARAFMRRLFLRRNTNKSDNEEPLHEIEQFEGDQESWKKDHKIQEWRPMAKKEESSPRFIDTEMSNVFSFGNKQTLGVEEDTMEFRLKPVECNLEQQLIKLEPYKDTMNRRKQSYSLLDYERE